MTNKLTWMTNLLVGDHQVAVVDIDESVLEGSDMSWIPLWLHPVVTVGWSVSWSVGLSGHNFLKRREDSRL